MVLERHLPGTTMILRGKSYVLRPASHDCDVMKAMDEQRRRHDNSLCDITLAFDGTFAFAHKAVLAACSTYFKEHFAENNPQTKQVKPDLRRNSPLKPCMKQRSMDSIEPMSPPITKRRRKTFSETLPEAASPFSPNSPMSTMTPSPRSIDLGQASPRSTSTDESSREIVPLPGIKSKSFSMILDHMYTSELCISEDNIYDIMLVANLLQVRTVIDACILVLSKEPRWKITSPKLKYNKKRLNSTWRSRSIMTKDKPAIMTSQCNLPSTSSIMTTKNDSVRKSLQNCQNGSSNQRLFVSSAMEVGPITSNAREKMIDSRGSTLALEPRSTRDNILQYSRSDIVTTRQNSISFPASDRPRKAETSLSSHPSKLSTSVDQNSGQDYRTSHGGRKSSRDGIGNPAFHRMDQAPSSNPCNLDSKHEKITRRSRTVSEGPHHCYDNNALDLRQRRGDDKLSCGESNSSEKKTHESIFRDRFAEESHNTTEADRKRKVSRGFFRRQRQVRSNSDEAINKKVRVLEGEALANTTTANYLPTFQPLPDRSMPPIAVIPTSSLTKHPVVLPTSPYVVPDKVHTRLPINYNAYLLDQQCAAIANTMYSKPASFYPPSTIPLYNPPGLIFSDSSKQTMFPSPLTWPLIPNLLPSHPELIPKHAAASFRVAKNQSHDAVTSSNGPSSLDKLGFFLPGRDARSISAVQSFERPPAHYDASQIKHLRKRKLMSAAVIGDCGTDTESLGAVSVDSGVADDHNKMEPNHSLLSIDDLSAKSPLSTDVSIMTSSGMNGVSPMTRCDQMRMKDNDVTSRQQQCVM